MTTGCHMGRVVMGVDLGTADVLLPSPDAPPAVSLMAATREIRRRCPSEHTGQSVLDIGSSRFTNGWPEQLPASTLPGPKPAADRLRERDEKDRALIERYVFSDQPRTHLPTQSGLVANARYRRTV
jgi:hypothetical protein